MAAALIACLAAGCASLGADDGSGEDDKADLSDGLPRGAATVALNHNLLNQFAFQLWRLGAVNLTMNETQLSDALSAVPNIELLNPIIEATAAAAMPPVFDEQNGKLILSIGELRIELFLGTDLFQATILANVSARLDIDLRVENNALRVEPELVELHIDLERKALAGLNPESLKKLIEAMAPDMVRMIADQLETMPLPTLDLGSAGFGPLVLGLDSPEFSVIDSGIRLSGDLTDVPAADVARPSDPPLPGQEPSFIGGGCVENSDCQVLLGPDGQCLTEADGFTKGHCTVQCTRTCADHPDFSTTFCVAERFVFSGGGDSIGVCHSRVDFDQFPSSGCRTDYVAEQACRPNQGACTDVCVPR